MSTGTMLRSAIAPTIPHISLSPPSRALTASSPRARAPLLRFLLRALPARNGGLLRALERELARRRVFRDRRSPSDRRVRADGDRRDEHRARADERAVADRRLVLVRAVVVASDRARADVHVAADLRVAEVGEVID